MAVQALKLMPMVVLAKMQALMERPRTAFLVGNPELATRIRAKH